MKTAEEPDTQRNEAMDMCTHEPRCPNARGQERTTARVSARHPEQGWSLLCNGVIVFDDGGALLPDGRSIAPPRAVSRRSGTPTSCAA